jgi:peptide/nickel transport system permease protein
MLRYFLKRLALFIPIIILVSFIVYGLMSLSGDPAQTIAGDDMTEEQIEMLREKMGLNAPFLIRYGRYIIKAMQGDFGEGLYGKNVWNEYISRLPYTIVLAVVSMILMVLLSVPLGIIAALKRNTWIDAIVSAIAVIGLSIPGFWLGIMLILWFALGYRLVPTGGATTWSSIILPALTAAAPNAALVCRTTRSTLLDALSADYLRTARAKVVDESTVVLRHALGNALIPIITIVGSQFSILIGGTVVVETVFSWPGVGNLIVTAVRGNDYNMVTGCVVLTTVLVALILLGVDMMYALVDPRIKAQYSRR